MKPAPIVLFVYNRPSHTRMTLESLQQNFLSDQSELFVYADGPKPSATGEQVERIKEVRAIIREKKWCGIVHIVESSANKGLADSIISGVTNLVKEYGKVIVLEDDLVLSPGFLKYMNDALDFYEKKEEVMHISGYMFPVSVKLPETFFFNSTSCWGWGTWKRAWDFLNTDASELLSLLKKNGMKKKFGQGTGFTKQIKANITGEISTWAVKWNASVFLQRGLCLHPRQSLVRNIGHDGSGVHCNDSEYFRDQIIAENIIVRPIELKENHEARIAVEKLFDVLYGNRFFSRNNFKNILRKILRRKLYNYIKNKSSSTRIKRSAF